MHPGRLPSKHWEQSNLKHSMHMGFDIMCRLPKLQGGVFILKVLACNFQQKLLVAPRQPPSTHVKCFSRETRVLWEVLG